jgi:hypothetical protein
MVPSHLKPPTALEKGAGSVATESALTVVGALVGGPLAPLLPVLAKSLAGERQRQRVEAALAEISSMLEVHDQALRELTDAQYKLLNETILAVLHTTSDEKLSYLRRAIRNGLAMTDVQPEEAVVLSRVIRDISAEEADFLVRNFSHQRLQFGTTSGPSVPGVFVVSDGGRNELIVSGLISLGLLIPAGPSMDDQGVMRFSNSVAKLIVLLR